MQNNFWVLRNPETLRALSLGGAPRLFTTRLMARSFATGFKAMGKLKPVAVKLVLKEAPHA